MGEQEVITWEEFRGAMLGWLISSPIAQGEVGGVRKRSVGSEGEAVV